MNTDNKKNLQEAQTLLDESKEQIPESLYITLSNLNKKLYEHSETHMYVVTYLDYRVSRPMTSIYKINTEVKKQYITLSDEQFQIYNKKKEESFEKKGYYLPSRCCLIGLDLKRLVTNPIIELYTSCCSEEEGNDCDNTYNHEVNLDFEIRILDIHKI